MISIDCFDVDGYCTICPICTMGAGAGASAIDVDGDGDGDVQWINDDETIMKLQK